VSDPALRLRPAAPADVPLILALVRELAEYEREPDAVEATEAMLADALFGPRPAAEAVVAEADEGPAGFALFFHNFSTWKGRRGLYLEDLYVRPAFRGRGIGRALLAHLAGVAVARGCGRFEWSVLDWNAPAIGFYRALGAEPMDGWTVMRLSGPALAALAGGEAPGVSS
jgi:GNAT superfamily N-acetyltransferase